MNFLNRLFSTSTSTQPIHYSGDTIDHSSTLSTTTPYTLNKNTKASNNPSNSVLNSEVIKFSAMASDWWDPFGSVGPLHSMNPVRVQYIKQQVLKYHKLNNTEHNDALPLQGYTILDIGCGGGLLCESLARLGATVTGIDATNAAIQVAKQHIALDHQIRNNVTYQYITAEELVQQNKQYDIVCALEIIEHVNQQAEFVNTIKQLVKPTGALFMSTLNQTYMSYLLAIVGAEYVMRLVARGTHDWNMFVPPSTLTQYICNDIVYNNNNDNSINKKFDIVDVQGMIYNPLTRQWWLQKNQLQVNYILHAKANVLTSNTINTVA